MAENPKYAIIGAGGGIGSETCRLLRASGAHVWLAGRSEQPLRELAAEIDAPYRIVDAADIEQVEQCVEEAVGEMGGLDGLVNCAGSILIKPAHLTSAADWEETIACNLTSAFAVVRAGSKALRAQGGAIVLMASAAARAGLPNHEAIAAAKGGVIGLTMAAAASYASRGIRVNAVAPGLVKTGMTERIWSNEKSAEMSRSLHAIGRLGQPHDVASLLTWLLDPANSWVTGQVFGVDGGLATLRNSGR